MFTSNVQFGYPCLRGGGGGQDVQAGLSSPPAQDLGQAVSSVNYYSTKNPLSIRNPIERLK